MSTIGAANVAAVELRMWHPTDGWIHLFRDHSRKFLGNAEVTVHSTPMEIEPLGTVQGHGIPTVRQQSIFVENRVGQLMRLTQILGTVDTRILAVSVVHSVDCAICRMILDDPDKAYEALRDARFTVSEVELLVVSLPHGKRALLHTWAALLGGEVNIHYTYPLLVHPRGAAALAVFPDNIDLAVTVLREHNFELLDQEDLREFRGE